MIEITNGIVKSAINYTKRRNVSNYLLVQDKEYNKIQFIIEFNELNRKHHERFQFIRKELIEKGRKEIYPIIEKALQIKNIPFSKKGEPIEGIPIIPKPTFFKFITSIGNLSVFICKDFLVNFEVIDKWMNKNKIATLLVPSFTKLVNPFIYKFGNIIRKRYNENKTIAFVNIAEYGGSGIYNLSYLPQYEPGKKSLFKDKEEDCKSFERDAPRDL